MINCLCVGCTGGAACTEETTVCVVHVDCSATFRRWGGFIPLALTIAFLEFQEINVIYTNDDPLFQFPCSRTCGNSWVSGIFQPS